MTRKKHLKSATRGIKSELNVGLDMLRSAMDGRSDSSEPKMKIFNQCGEMDFIPDSFASALLADCKPDWIPLDLYFQITDSLIGFDSEMALVIADDIIDCWSGLGLHVTGIQHIDDLPRKAYEQCERTAYKKIYHCKDVVDIEIAGYKVITMLTHLMVQAATHSDRAFSRLLINRVSTQYDILAPTLYERIMAVLDYISGMTDVFALGLYRKINGMSLPDV